jgi:hypothetical protein
MKIAYCGVILDTASHKLLKELFKKEFPDLADWKIYCHHMTIRLGALPKELKERQGEIVELQVQFIGRKDKAVAVRVHDKQGLSSSTHPHVTLAVDPNGGKPVMSNFIIAWSPLTQYDLTVKGTIEEVLST